VCHQNHLSNLDTIAAAMIGNTSRSRLAESSERLVRAVTAHAPVGVFVTNAEGECEYANERLCELTGSTEVQALGFGWTAALHPDDAARVTAAWAEASSAGEDFLLEYRFLRPEGSVVWIEGSASAIRDGQDAIVGWIGICVDLTARKLSEKRYRDLFDNARDAVYTTDAAGNFISVNKAAVQITGFTREELVAMNFCDLIAPEDAERAQASLAPRFAGQEDEIVELQLVAKDGHRVYVEVTGRLVEENGRAIRMEGIARDTSERHTLQETLVHQAFHDSLTGLPNRALFLDRLAQALVGAGRRGSQVVVMLLDLDNFKLVNDSLGHGVGDELLMAIAPRLERMMQGSDTVARLGGDEFAFVIEVSRNEHESIAVAERVLAAFDDPFTVGSGTQRVTASLGIALGKQGDNPDDVLRNADTALYRAKATRRGSFELFDEGMRDRVLLELTFRSALADALQNHELHLDYQPIVSLESGEILATEALVRWLHPQWGWIAPNTFIPVAEETGLIVPLGQYVLTEAARQAAEWRYQYPEALPLGVFVNVSPRQLSEPGFIPFLTQTLREQGLAASRLGIEITELVFIDEREDVVAANLAELGRMGIRLSLDDFGTGYSALASLDRFPVTALKIDRSFIRSIRNMTDTAPISTAIVSLGKALGLTVIAEGIENQVQADHLRSLGCDAGQGFHLARPQSANELSTLFSARSKSGTSAERSRRRPFLVTAFAPEELVVS
jgi:diguanylate cyclase (GGDEF)-like protein/PAS domain S-box-containing protein